MKIQKGKSMKIDIEFKNLIPALTQEEFAGLENSIKAEGCREAIITWNDTIVDGHNRYEICTRHNIPFRTCPKDFADRNDAKIWIIKNQFSRRNLSAFQRTELALELEHIFREKAKENQKLSQGQGVKGCQNSDNLKTAPGKNPQLLPKHTKAAEPIDTKKELAKIADVSHDTIAKVKTIKEKATPEIIEKVRSGDKSINEVYKEIRKQEKIQNRENRNDNFGKSAEIPEGVYTVIYADPPWRYDFSETVSREIENQYPTMELEEIKAMKIPAAECAVLFLWATAPKLKEALGVMEAWGFEYKTHAIWDKKKIGMGYWFRGQHELLLVGTRGNYPPPLPANRVSSVICAERTEHSAKPDLYELIEKMCPNGKYLELFARGEKTNKSWAFWGNQAG